MKRFNKIISSVVLVCFIFNTAVQDYVFALSPGQVSGDLRPADRADAVRDAMYSAGEKLIAERKGPGEIDFDRYIKMTSGVSPDRRVKWDFVPADYENAISKIGSDPVYRETGIGRAASIIAQRLTSNKVLVGVGDPDKAHSGAPAWVDDKVVFVSVDFARKWDMLRRKDIWFEYTIGGVTRTESAAWAVFKSVFNTSPDKRAKSVEDVVMDNDSMRFAVAFLDAALKYRDQSAKPQAADLSAPLKIRPEQGRRTDLAAVSKTQKPRYIRVKREDVIKVVEAQIVRLAKKGGISRISVGLEYGDDLWTLLNEYDVSHNEPRKSVSGITTGDLRDNLFRNIAEIKAAHFVIQITYRKDGLGRFASIDVYPSQLKRGPDGKFVSRSRGSAVTGSSKPQSADLSAPLKIRPEQGRRTDLAAEKDGAAGRPVLSKKDVIGIIDRGDFAALRKEIERAYAIAVERKDMSYFNALAIAVYESGAYFFLWREEAMRTISVDIRSAMARSIEDFTHERSEAARARLMDEKAGRIISPEVAPKPDPADLAAAAAPAVDREVARLCRTLNDIPLPLDATKIAMAKAVGVAVEQLPYDKITEIVVPSTGVGESTMAEQAKLAKLLGREEVTSEVIYAVRASLSDPAQSPRLAAIRDLAAKKASAAPAVPDLEKLLNHPDIQKDHFTVDEMLRALRDIGPASVSALPTITQFTKASWPRDTRDLAVSVIKAMGRAGKTAVPDVVAYMQEKSYRSTDSQVYCAGVIESITDSSDREALKALEVMRDAIKKNMEFSVENLDLKKIRASYLDQLAKLGIHADFIESASDADLAKVFADALTKSDLLKLLDDGTIRPKLSDIELRLLDRHVQEGSTAPLQAAELKALNLAVIKAVFPQSPRKGEDLLLLTAVNKAIKTISGAAPIETPAVDTTRPRTTGELRRLLTTPFDASVRDLVRATGHEANFFTADIIKDIRQVADRQGLSLHQKATHLAEKLAMPVADSEATAILRASRDPDQHTRVQAIEAIGGMGDKGAAAVPDFERLLADEGIRADGYTLSVLVTASGLIGAGQATLAERVADLLGKADCRDNCLEALAKIGRAAKPQASKAARVLNDNGFAKTRVLAARALAGITDAADEEAAEALRKRVAEDSSALVRNACGRALKDIGKAVSGAVSAGAAVEEAAPEAARPEPVAIGGEFKLFVFGRYADIKGWRYAAEALPSYDKFTITELDWDTFIIEGPDGVKDTLVVNEESGDRIVATLAAAGAAAAAAQDAEVAWSKPQAADLSAPLKIRPEQGRRTDLAAPSEGQILAEKVRAWKAAGTITELKRESEAILSEMRRDYIENTKKTSPERFRELAREAGNVLAYKAYKMSGNRNAAVVLPWRAALSLAVPFRQYFGRFAHIGLVRDEKTGDSSEYYINYKNIDPAGSDPVIIVDPMLATGGSISHAIERLTGMGVKQNRIILVTVISAPEGLARILDRYPDIRIITGAVDERLDERFYIVPGLGDFGDRYFDGISDGEILSWKDLGIINDADLAALSKRIGRDIKADPLSYIVPEQVLSILRSGNAAKVAAWIETAARFDGMKELADIISRLSANARLFERLVVSRAYKAASATLPEWALLMIGVAYDRAIAIRHEKPESADFAADRGPAEKAAELPGWMKDRFEALVEREEKAHPAFREVWNNVNKIPDLYTLRKVLAARVEKLRDDRIAASLRLAFLVPMALGFTGSAAVLFLHNPAPMAIALGIMCLAMAALVTYFNATGGVIQYAAWLISISSELAAVRAILRVSEDIKSEMTGRNFVWPVYSAADFSGIVHDIKAGIEPISGIWDESCEEQTDSAPDTLTLKGARGADLAVPPSVSVTRYGSDVVVVFDAMFTGDVIRKVTLRIYPDKVELDETAPLAPHADLPTTFTKNIGLGGFSVFKGIGYKDDVWSLYFSPEFLNILKIALKDTEVELPQPVKLLPDDAMQAGPQDSAKPEAADMKTYVRPAEKSDDADVVALAQEADAAIAEAAADSRANVKSISSRFASLVSCYESDGLEELLALGEIIASLRDNQGAVYRRTGSKEAGRKLEMIYELRTIVAARMAGIISGESADSIEKPQSSDLAAAAAGNISENEKRHLLASFEYYAKDDLRSLMARSDDITIIRSASHSFNYTLVDETRREVWDGMMHDRGSVIVWRLRASGARGADMTAGQGRGGGRKIRVEDWKVAGYVLPVVAEEEIGADKVMPQEVLVPDRIGAEEARRVADEALRKGRVAVIDVAGGMSSRAGIDFPKGMYPIAPLSKKTLFEKRAEEIRAFGDRYGAPVLWIVMTSDFTDEATRKYFVEKRHFGLGMDNVIFIKQASVPALESGTDRPAMESAEYPLLAPNGHGGLYRAMQDASARTDGAKVSAIETAARRGVGTFLFTNVDNPMPVIDRLVIGYHIIRGSDFTSVMLRKRDPSEGLAMAVETTDGKDRFFVEYNQPVAETLKKRPGYEYGSINRLVFSRGFLADTPHPAYRVARNKEAVIFKDGVRQKGRIDKFESFVFERQGLAKKTLNIEGLRDESFSTFKKMEGPDSPETVAAALSELDKKRVRGAVDGSLISDESTLELSRAFAVTDDEIRAKIGPGFEMAGSSNVYFGGKNIRIGQDVRIDSSDLIVNFEDPYDGSFQIPSGTVIIQGAKAEITVGKGGHVVYGRNIKPEAADLAEAADIKDGVPLENLGKRHVLGSIIAEGVIGMTWERLADIISDVDNDIGSLTMVRLNLFSSGFFTDGSVYYVSDGKAVNGCLKNKGGQWFWEDIAESASADSAEESTGQSAGAKPAAADLAVRSEASPEPAETWKKALSFMAAFLGLGSVTAQKKMQNASEVIGEPPSGRRRNINTRVAEHGTDNQNSVSTHEMEAMINMAGAWRESVSEETLAKVVPMIERKDWPMVASEMSAITGSIFQKREEGKPNIEEYAKLQSICVDIFRRGLREEFMASGVLRVFAAERRFMVEENFGMAETLFSGEAVKPAIPGIGEGVDVDAYLGELASGATDFTKLDNLLDKARKDPALARYIAGRLAIIRQINRSLNMYLTPYFHAFQECAAAEDGQVQAAVSEQTKTKPQAADLAAEVEESEGEEFIAEVAPTTQEEAESAAREVESAMEATFRLVKEPADKLSGAPAGEIKDGTGAADKEIIIAEPRKWINPATGKSFTVDDLTVEQMIGSLHLHSEEDERQDMDKHLGVAGGVEPADKLSGAPAEVPAESAAEDPYAVELIRARNRYDGMDLREIISEYISRVSAEIGREAVPELAISDKERVYKAAYRFQHVKTRVLFPQRVISSGQMQSFRLEDPVVKTLREMQEKVRGKGGSFAWGEYAGKQNLEKLLGSETDTLNIVITEDALAGEVGELLRTRPKLFKDTRLYNMGIPENYSGMDRTARSVCQARAVTLAILIRLYEDGDVVVRSLLDEMLTGRLEEGVDKAAFIDSIPEKAGESDAARRDRLGNFLKWRVSLVELLGRQLKLLEKFVWSAA